MDGVSIIICCYNSAARLPETLKHIVLQKVHGVNWEVIIIDNASTDNTYDLAHNLLVNSNVAFQIAKEPQPGLIYARLKGQSLAKYDFLLYCDDDNWLNENYVQLAYNTITQNPKIAILGGKGEAVFESVEPFWFKNFQHNFAVGEQSTAKEDISRIEEAYGAGFTVRKSFLEKIEKLGIRSLLAGRTGKNLTSGDDTELCYFAGILGMEVWYNRKLTFKHFMAAGRMNWPYMKKLYAGFGRANIYTYAYKYVMEHKRIPGENLKYPLWLDTYIHKIKNLIDFYPKVIFKFGKEGDADVLRFTAIKAEASEIWRLKDDYKKMYENIFALLNKNANTA